MAHRPRCARHVSTPRPTAGRRCTIWGMGIARVRDLDGDGKPEVFITSQGDNKLQTLDGDGNIPSYKDITLAGASPHSGRTPAATSCPPPRGTPSSRT